MNVFIEMRIFRYSFESELKSDLESDLKIIINDLRRIFMRFAHTMRKSHIYVCKLLFHNIIDITRNKISLADICDSHRLQK